MATSIFSPFRALKTLVVDHDPCSCGPHFLPHPKTGFSQYANWFETDTHKFKVNQIIKCYYRIAFILMHKQLWKAGSSLINKFGRARMHENYASGGWYNFNTFEWAPNLRDLIIHLLVKWHIWSLPFYKLVGRW